MTQRSIGSKELTVRLLSLPLSQFSIFQILLASNFFLKRLDDAEFRQIGNEVLIVDDHPVISRVAGLCLRRTTQ